jgi:hydrogenase maturation protein HypF
MAVEHAALEAWGRETGDTGYPVEIRKDPEHPDREEIDWRPMIRAIQEDLQADIAPGVIAVRVHLALADTVRRLAQAVGLPRVVLSGGCFQNGLLVELARERLASAGFEVFTHREVPPNDGGLSLGQAVVAYASRTGRVEGQ